MRDTERGKEVGDRYKVLISDLLPPIYIWFGVTKVSTWYIIGRVWQFGKEKEKKKKICKGSCMEATKVISGVQGVFSDSVSKFKSPRMVNIIYTLGRLLIEDTLCLWV